MSVKSIHKLGVIVPYRNRHRQLANFKRAIIKHLNKSGIEFELIIVEQDDATAFNRGKLLNIGFVEAEELGCDYVVFHDVDMIPEKVDYSFRTVPTHLATNFISGETEIGLHFEQYFGGVTLFPSEIFREVNGYSNEYWGWGFEDDDLFSRLLEHEIPTDIFPIEKPFGSTASLEFNGKTSYVTIPNKINFLRDWTISTTFTPYELELDPKEDSDRNSIFTIPGYDFSVYYSSFNRFIVEIFDRRKNSHTVTSEITSETTSNITLIWDNFIKVLKVYINGNLIESLEIEKGLFNYSKEDIIYVGAGNLGPNNYHKHNFFKGSIEYFATFDKALTTEEVKEIFNTRGLSLTTDFGDYISKNSLLSYHDGKVVKDYKLVDLVDLQLNGDLFDIKFVPTPLSSISEIPVPYRSTSTFRLLDHEPGGYLDGRWKDKLTRFNQLRFVNEVKPGHRKSRRDGLNRLRFTLHERKKKNNETQVVVGL